MTTEDFITDLFDRVDTKMYMIPKHSQAHLYPSEVVTLALLFAIKGVGTRAFYRWLVKDWRDAFPNLPERTRLFRLFKTHRDWANRAKEGDPINLKICDRNTWNPRMLVETVLSMLTTVCHFKKLTHRVWEYFEATLGFTMAAFNIMVQWHGLKPDPDGFVPLSIAEFSL